MSETKKLRADHVGEHKTAYLKNRQRIFATKPCCGICGQPIDYTLKYPNPKCATIDHIIPVSRGGHPSDISNLQAAHLSCNRAKSSKMQSGKFVGNAGVIPNNILPWSIDWTKYKSEDN